jgi:hypothetical protein
VLFKTARHQIRQAFIIKFELIIISDYILGVGGGDKLCNQNFWCENVMENVHSRRMERDETKTLHSLDDEEGWHRVTCGGGGGGGGP